MAKQDVSLTWYQQKDLQKFRWDKTCLFSWNWQGDLSGTYRSAGKLRSQESSWDYQSRMLPLSILSSLERSAIFTWDASSMASSQKGRDARWSQCDQGRKNGLDKREPSSAPRQATEKRAHSKDGKGGGLSCSGQLLMNPICPSTITLARNPPPVGWNLVSRSKGPIYTQGFRCQNLPQMWQVEVSVGYYCETASDPQIIPSQLFLKS